MLVVVTGAVAALAIYTFAWRSDNGSSEREARSYAAAVAATCDPRACQIRRLVHIGGDDWKAVLREPTDGQVGCLLIQTNRFAERASGNFAGASRMRCPEARPPRVRAAKQPQPVGPEWWDTDEAATTIEHSRWAFSHNLKQAIFDCVGQGVSRGELFRHFACTYDYGGAQLNESGRVEITTTGRDTFRVVSTG